MIFEVSRRGELFTTRFADINAALRLFPLGLWLEWLRDFVEHQVNREAFRRRAKFPASLTSDGRVVDSLAHALLALPSVILEVLLVGDLREPADRTIHSGDLRKLVQLGDMSVESAKSGEHSAASLHLADQTFH